MRNNSNGTVFKGIASTHQAISERFQFPLNTKVSMTLGKVVAVYSDRMTCDIETSNGMVQHNVPLLTSGGLIDDKVFGTVELPVVDTTVIIGFIEDRETFPFIFGTLLPYIHNKFQTDQTAVNSDNKTTALTLLENSHDTMYRKIFPSGTTVQVMDDGTIQVETPSGTLLEISEGDSGKLTVNAAGDISVTDVNSNSIEMDSSGMTLTDTNGNTVVMGSSSVMINGNLEILQ